MVNQLAITMLALELRHMFFSELSLFFFFFASMTEGQKALKYVEKIL